MSRWVPLPTQVTVELRSPYQRVVGICLRATEYWRRGSPQEGTYACRYKNHSLPIQGIACIFCTSALIRHRRYTVEDFAVVECCCDGCAPRPRIKVACTDMCVHQLVAENLPSFTQRPGLNPCFVTYLNTHGVVCLAFSAGAQGSFRPRYPLSHPFEILSDYL